MDWILGYVKKAGLRLCMNLPLRLCIVSKAFINRDEFRNSTFAILFGRTKYSSLSEAAINSVPAVYARKGSEAVTCGGLYGDATQSANIFATILRSKCRTTFGDNAVAAWNFSSLFFLALYMAIVLVFGERKFRDCWNENVVGKLLCDMLMDMLMRIGTNMKMWDEYDYVSECVIETKI